ncbi:MAG: lipoyl synthase [Chloroflexota bacterium]|nr:MAG: lipoyl synthase [Chloroflexota bacterium]
MSTPDVPSQRLPNWLVRPVCQGKHLNEVRRTLSRLRLNTVCESALCPNMGECFSRRTATFMIMGNTCTRNCRFCAVEAGCPIPLDPSEPARVAEAARSLGLDHVVVTSVTRDDVPDGGAKHFAETIRAIREVNRNASVEVLVPDFGGSEESVETVAREKPDIFNHNLETIPSLYKEVRPGADYQRSLALLKAVKQIDENMVTKSGLMLGLGETSEELIDVLKDLRQADCDIITLGQYLRPSDNHTPVRRFIPPEEFAHLAGKAEELGFRGVVAAPFVRSSYKSGQLLRQLSPHENQ